LTHNIAFAPLCAPPTTHAHSLRSFVAQIEQSLRGWLFTGLENISHMAPAAGADKRPGTLVKLSNTLQHK
jgi:hypothetical protein